METVGAIFGPAIGPPATALSFGSLTFTRQLPATLGGPLPGPRNARQNSSSARASVAAQEPTVHFKINSGCPASLSATQPALMAGHGCLRVHCRSFRSRMHQRPVRVGPIGAGGRAPRFAGAVTAFAADTLMQF
jgi:hypothetical protein